MLKHASPPFVTVQQIEHYDRRTQVDRENKGREYTGNLLKTVLLSTAGTGNVAGPSSTREPAACGGGGDSDSDSDGEGPGMGDIVAIVMPGSTVTEPNIEVGKVQRLSKDKSMLRYLRMSHIGGNRYHCEVGQVRKATSDQWIYPVDCHYSPSDNTYHLRSTPTELHLSKHPHT